MRSAKLKANKRIDIQIFTHMIDEDTPNHENLEVSKGDVFDVDILSETEDTYSEVQFADGDMAYQLAKSLFIEVN